MWVSSPRSMLSLGATQSGLLKLAPNLAANLRLTWASFNLIHVMSSTSSRLRSRLLIRKLIKKPSPRQRLLKLRLLLRTMRPRHRRPSLPRLRITMVPQPRHLKLTRRCLPRHYLNHQHRPSSHQRLHRQFLRPRFPHHQSQCHQYPHRQCLPTRWLRIILLPAARILLLRMTKAILLRNLPCPSRRPVPLQPPLPLQHRPRLQVILPKQ